MATYTKIWHDWLHHPATGQMILTCFRGIVARGRKLGFPREVWPYETDAEVAAEVWLLLKKRSDEPPQTLVGFILAENSGAVCNYLKDYIFNQHRDWMRSGKIDPWLSMYRLIRQALAATQDITYRPELSGSWYAWSLVPDLPKEPMRDIDFSTWPKAPEPDKKFRTKDNARDMARFVWDQEFQRSGRPKLLPVRAVVEYLQTHFAIEFEKPQRVDLGPLTPEGGNPVEQFPESATQELEVTRSHLAEIAKACSCSLSPRQRSVFVLRMEEDQKLEQIAGKLGVSVSTASNELERIAGRLRQHCSLWCGLAADDLDEQLFFEFGAKLTQACKDWLEDRS